MGCFFLAFTAFTRTAIIVVSSRNLAIFLSVLSEIHPKIDQIEIACTKAFSLTTKLPDKFLNNRG